MGRSNAQRAADKKYRKNHPKGCGVPWGTTLRVEDAEELEEVRKRAGKGRAEFLRWATQQLKSEMETGG